jgi:Icc-related predicted phosphoesterase
MGRTRFLFSSDFHGSETVWRKFLNAARIFDLDALILSGDMTAKVMVPIIRQPDGTYRASLLGQDYLLTEEEVPKFEEKCRLIAYIPYRTTLEEAHRIAADEEYREALFERLEAETIRHWLSLIPGRVPEKCKVIMSPGNDDKFSVDEVLRGDPRVIYGSDEVVWLDDEHEVLCCGWANKTPFNSPRELTEEELEAKLESLVARVKNLRTAVFCIHVPPYDTPIDVAPALDKDLRPIVRGSQVLMVPVGSKAVRRIIEKYQPLLALHGHVHESPGFVRIGRTQCLNPGSEYNEGIFKGFLVEIEGDRILKLQRVEA